MGLSNSTRKLFSKSLSASQHTIKSKLSIIFCMLLIFGQYLNQKKNYSKAYVDIVDTWGWKSYTIIYETNDGLLRLQELLKAQRRSKHPTTVRQLPDTNDYRYFFLQMKQMNVDQKRKQSGKFRLFF